VTTTEPAWVAVGQQVLRLQTYTGHTRVLGRAVIARLTKTMIVLDNGERYRRRDLEATYDDYGPIRRITSEADPKALRLYRAQQLTHQAAKLGLLAGKLSHLPTPAELIALESEARGLLDRIVTYRRTLEG